MSKGENDSLPEELLNKLKYYFQDVDPLRASRSLRKVFFDYLRFQDGLRAMDFDTILNDVETAIELLELIADEKMKGGIKVT